MSIIISIICLFFRCPDELGFSSFAVAAAAASANTTTPFSSMPYLKTSPYLMTVDPLHSMGYSATSKYHHLLISFILISKIFQLFIPIL